MIVTLCDVTYSPSEREIKMTQISGIRAAFGEFVSSFHANRAARADRARLEAALRGYTSSADRAEMDAILGRYPESETHLAWAAISAPAPSPAWAHA